MGHRDNQWHVIKRPRIKISNETSLILLVIVSFYILLFNLPAYAEIVPRVTVTQYYNDNVSLKPEGMEEHANITEISPGVRIVHDGKRVDSELDYRMQALYFSGKKDNDEVHHNVIGQARVEMLPQTLFVDASLDYSQQFISPEGQLDLDNLSVTTNRTDVLSYRLSPYLRQRYGNFISAEYKFTYDELKYDDPNAVTEKDSVVKSSEINFASGPVFDEFNWRLAISSSVLSADDVSDSTLRNATLLTRYKIGPKTEFLLDVGYEDNDFALATNEESPTGKIWNVGLGWNFTRRTQVEIRTGERFFGKTSAFLFRHRTKRSTWEVTYNEDITTTQQLQQELRDTTFEFENELGELESVTAPVPFLERVSSVIVVERFSLSANYRAGKSTLTIGAYNDVRDFQGENRNEDTLGGNISWRWRMLPRTGMTLAGEWSRLKLSSDGRVDHYGLGQLIFTRQLGRSTEGSVGYKVTDRNSTDATSEYTRDLTYVSVSTEF